MNKLILKQEVLDAYEGYIKAFIEGDTKKVFVFTTATVHGLWN